jgi:predicted nucleic acid-binding protein
MRTFFDTSVLVPIFVSHHQHHAASLYLFLQADKQSACCGVHSLAEFYSTVTRMPGRIGGREALLLVAQVRERLAVVALDEGEYVRALERCVEFGITAGSIYDALLAACALKADAEEIYT